MSRFNTSSTHPLIPNAQDYMLYKKFISIHSEDRDTIKYPLSTEFEIELPQDYCNVQSVRLSKWTFPANYNTFSLLQNNISMTFKITEAYNPGDFGYANPLQDAIFEILYENANKNYVIIIEEGFYNPAQISTELTNRFNTAVSSVIANSLKTVPTYIAQNLYDEFIANSYNEFIIVYNTVAQKLYFGNRSSQFELTNDSEEYFQVGILQSNCLNKNIYPEFVNWGLPAYLGLTRCPSFSVKSGVENLPRFYYGDSSPGDGGYWLTPNPLLPGSTVGYVQAPLKINLMGPSAFYMELDGMNCVDETMPFAISRFTMQTNETNGVVNSAFAKIPIPTTPLSQWFDNGMDSYMLYNPPAEKIRKLRLKLRYHNGAPVYFGSFDYSFSLEFNMLVPQLNRKMNVYVPN